MPDLTSEQERELMEMLRHMETAQSHELRGKVQILLREAFIMRNDLEKAEARAEAAERQVAAQATILAQILANRLEDDGRVCESRAAGTCECSQCLAHLALRNTASAANAYEARIKAPLEKRIAELEAERKSLRTECLARKILYDNMYEHKAVRDYFGVAKAPELGSTLADDICARIRADERRKVLQGIVDDLTNLASISTGELKYTYMGLAEDYRAQLATLEQQPPSETAEGRE